MQYKFTFSVSQATEDELYSTLRSTMMHFFGSHQNCDGECDGTNQLSGIIIQEKDVAKMKERWNKTFLSVCDSLILNKNTNMAES